MPTKKNADYDKLKELYMARRIAEMVHGQVDVFISFGSGDKVNTAKNLKNLMQK